MLKILLLQNSTIFTSTLLVLFPENNYFPNYTHFLTDPTLSILSSIYNIGKTKQGIKKKLKASGFKVLKTVNIMKSLVVSFETQSQLYISMNPIQSKLFTLRLTRTSLKRDIIFYPCNSFV